MRGTIVWIVAAVLLLSGCVGNAIQSDASPTSTSPTRGGTVVVGPNNETILVPDRPVLGFHGCSEMNLLIPIPVEEMGELPHGLRPVTRDPLGQIAEITYTPMACETLDADGQPVKDPRSGWVLIAVHPSPKLTLSGASSYAWLVAVATKQPEIMVVAESLGIGVDKADIELSFEELAGNQKAQGHFRGTFDDFQLRADSVMAGAPAAGAAGTLGLYTVAEEGAKPPLVGHLVNFTAHKAYRNGVAVLQPGFLPLPFADAVAGATTATHNVDYGARFDFNVAKAA